MEVSHLKEILGKNAVPVKLVDNCIKSFFSKIFLHNPLALTFEKKELIIALSYLGNLSLAIRTHLQNSISKNLPFCNVKVIFKSTTCLSTFYRYKDKVPFNLCSNAVSKFWCSRCNVSYYDNKCQHLNIRVGEDSGVSPLTGKKSNAKTTTAIKDHMLLCDHVVSLKDFEILASINSEFYHNIKESILIPRDKPELNRNDEYSPLYLYG